MVVAARSRRPRKNPSRIEDGDSGWISFPFASVVVWKLLAIPPKIACTGAQSQGRQAQTSPIRLQPTTEPRCTFGFLGVILEPFFRHVWPRMDPEPTNLHSITPMKLGALLVWGNANTGRRLTCWMIPRSKFDACVNKSSLSFESSALAVWILFLCPSYNIFTIVLDMD